MSKRRILSTFIIGAILGSIIGILSAPYSGKKTREKVINKTKKLLIHKRKV